MNADGPGSDVGERALDVGDDFVLVHASAWIISALSGRRMPSSLSCIRAAMIVVAFCSAGTRIARCPRGKGHVRTNGWLSRTRAV